MRSVTSNWTGHMTSFWETSPFHGASNMCTKVLFSKSIRSICAQPSPCSKGNKEKEKEELSKLGTICGRYWFLNWAHIFEQHETASQNKQCQPKNKPHILGVCRIICYYGPHGSAHHPTPLDTFFHPRRLPPRGSQTQVEY